MTNAQTIARLRFGYGIGPRPANADPEAMLKGLARGNRIATAYPVASTTDGLRRFAALRMARKTMERDGSQAAMKDAQARIAELAGQGFVHAFARILDTETPFFERLTWFWANHFTATAKTAATRAIAPAYIDEAIRPHVAGRFSDMLKAVITHPFMLAYLDQASSVGPNSRIGRRRKAGLNENLARELLELHTLGVKSAYTQADVRQMAELLTGLTISPQTGFRFVPAMAEPGAETVLGKRYGGGAPGLADVMQALDDLAAHPSTAAHIARKLASHFVSDTPEPGLLAHLEQAFRASDGDLVAVYAALLEHPAAWKTLGAKARQPFDFVAASLLTLGFSGKELTRFEPRVLRRALARPLAAMGQPFMSAPGPNGWPEEAEAWITPQGLATRIAWARGLAQKVFRRLPDARQFVDIALADAAPRRLRQAVAAAETQADGIMLVLASAEFNTR